MSMKKNNRLYMYVICMSLLIISLIGVYLFQDINITGFAVSENNASQTANAEVNLSRENALNSLLEAEEHIKEMKRYNLSVFYVNDLLLEAKRNYIGETISYINKDLEKEQDRNKLAYLESLLIIQKNTPIYEVKKLSTPEVFRITSLINDKKNQAYKILDTISLLEGKEQSYSKIGIETSEGLDLIKEAKKSFIEERYDEAEDLLNQANLKLDNASLEYNRVKGLLNLTKSFFAKYWRPIISIFLFLAIISYPAIKIIRKKLAKKKLINLKLELEVISKLLKRVQADYFSKRITRDTYRIRTERYKHRAAEIKHTIPVLEPIAKGGKK